MSARRDYADAWRDAWVTLAQVPVAGLLAADYFYQQWVERSSTYLSHVSTRLALARPASAVADEPGENIMADILSEDFVDATRGLVRDLVSLPGETATYFNRQLASTVREVLERIQPDAQTGTRTYLINELEKVNRELYRLREVAGAESTRRDLAGPPAAPGGRRDPDADALPNLQRTLDSLQVMVNGVLRLFPPEPPGPSPTKVGNPPSIKEQATRMLLALQNARDEVERAQREIDDETRGASRPRARDEIAETRRYPGRRKH